MTNEEKSLIQLTNENAERAQKRAEQQLIQTNNNGAVQNNSATPSMNERYKRVAQNSIGKGPIKTSTSKETNRMVDSAKIAIIICAIVSVIALGITTTLGANILLEDQITTKQEINRSTEALKTKALVELLNYNLAGVDAKTKNIEVKNNTIDDYRKLNVSKKLDVYIYWKILPSEEFDKFIQAVTYKEDYSDIICEYISFNQFLKINGYIYNDRGISIPAEDIFENYMESYIKDNYKELLEEYEYKYGYPSYTIEQVSSEYKEPTTKGGR